MRVGVTASRKWPDRKAVWFAIFSQYVDCEDPTDFTVVHGDCPSGGDRFAREFCIWVNKNTSKATRITEERHPADWSRACDESCYHAPRVRNGKPYCPMAGHLRNQEMVDSGIDVWLAFPLVESRGTKDCMRRARKAGQLVIEHEYAGKHRG